MGELLGITGAISSGKTTLAILLGECVQNHAHYATHGPIIEVANRFNQLLEAELNFDTANSDSELVNQALIWMPDVIAEHLHRDVTWTQLALTAKDQRAHPELYEKLFPYLAAVHKNPRQVEQTINEANKQEYRSLLQWLGAYFVARISPAIWFDELFRRIELRETHTDLVLISGVRYQSDAAIVREHGGRIIAITRPGIDSANSSDPTEAERGNIEADIHVINNGTLDQLQALSETIWNDIAAGAPKKEYVAA